MRSVPFKISVQTLNECIMGRWLCLDGLLDIALELQGVAPRDRVLPLSGWTGSNIVTPGAYSRSDYEDGKIIAMGSAAEVVDPLLTSRTLVQSVGRLLKADSLPCISNAGRVMNKIDVARNEAAAKMNSVRTIAPTRIVWEGHGDPEATREILESLPGIGAKTAQGWGRFERPAEISESDERLSGIIDSAEGRLLRPLPDTFRVAVGNAAFRRAIETVSAPYWKREMAVSALIPQSDFADGILRNYDHL